MIKAGTLLIILTLFLSCKKDRPDDHASALTLSANQGVFIGSEGNFQFGNASLSYYDFSSGNVSELVFKNNNNRELGDVCQSLYQTSDELYLTLNNSSKIEVINKYTFQSLGIINGLTSPRYFLPVSNQKAYVTDLYANAIYVVNKNNFSIQKQIKVNGWTEELVMVFGKVFVCHKDNNQLYVFDAASDELVDSIVVGTSPTAIHQDKNGMLWVLCSGDYQDENDNPALVQVSPVNMEVTKRFLFKENDQVSHLAFNGGNDTLYYLNKGVFQMDINEGSLPEVPLVNLSNHNLYGLGVDPSGRGILVSDAIDYVQRSTVMHYDSKGQLIKSFSAGINTGSFSFLR